MMNTIIKQLRSREFGSIGIWVFHRREFLYFSRLLDSDTVILNISPEVAGRFATKESGTAYLNAVLPLNLMAMHGYAGVAEIGKLYGGISRLAWRGERRLTSQAAREASHG